ncbi:hypothetical protein ACH495_10180 [Micromonospora sp. NPDC018662]|uniref:hypothetical protein n=1 Tax=Micromonospora sp. NPDC018662 TaxID=3364238 RepID=UPI0037A5E748
MPTPPLHADTDLLRGESFAPFVAHMQSVIDNLNAAVDDCLPVATTIRDKSDQVLNEGLAAQVEHIRMLLFGLRDLSAGDAEQLAVLNRLMGTVEELNTDVANFGGTRP